MAAEALRTSVYLACSGPLEISRQFRDDRTASLATFILPSSSRRPPTSPNALILRTEPSLPQRSLSPQRQCRPSRGSRSLMLLQRRWSKHSHIQWIEASRNPRRARQQLQQSTFFPMARKNPPLTPPQEMPASARPPAASSPSPPSSSSFGSPGANGPTTAASPSTPNSSSTRAGARRWRST